jgi:hypothetical protein
MQSGRFIIWLYYQIQQKEIASRVRSNGVILLLVSLIPSGSENLAVTQSILQQLSNITMD